MLPTVFIKKHFQMWGTLCKAYWVTLWSLNSVSVPGLYRKHRERAEAWRITYQRRPRDTVRIYKGLAERIARMCKFCCRELE